jgi:hypothetical protein
MKLLNEKEVAKMIGMSIYWMQRCRWLGTGIPFHKIGKKTVRYEEQSVLDWIRKEHPEQISTSQTKK